MKHFDKIFFLVALLVLCGGIGYMFMQKPEFDGLRVKVRRAISAKSEGVKWNEVKVPELKFTTIEWPEIVAQDADGKWFFQVFTPPQIWVDNDGKFITESPYIKEVARQNFALKYKGVSNEPYPIIYKGNMGDPKDPIINLYDEKTKQFLTARLNKEIVIPASTTTKEQKMGLTVKSLKSERVDSKNQTLVKRRYTLVIRDKSLKRDITIYSHKPTYLEDARKMTFLLPDGSEWSVKEAGGERRVDKGVYKIKSVDFDKPCAVVELVPDDKKLDIQTMELSPTGIVNVKNKKK